MIVRRGMKDMINIDQRGLMNIKIVLRGHICTFRRGARAVKWVSDDARGMPEEPREF